MTFSCFRTRKNGWIEKNLDIEVIKVVNDYFEEKEIVLYTKHKKT